MRSIAVAVATAALSFTVASAPSAWATDDGPHAAKNRQVAQSTSTVVDNARVTNYDLGNADIGAKPGQFVAPIRGTLVTPSHPRSATKLIIVSHLRTAGCADDAFSYPCHGAERRLDEGMTYLGQALAKQGYTVLIPDLAPVWIGSTLQAPYNQTAAWLKAVGAARDALASDVAGKTHHFGFNLTGSVDMSRAGLFVHSRSGFIAEPAIEAWAKGPTKIISVLAYGPAYDVPDANNNVTPAISANVPYLGLVGEQDNDVPFNADMWLGDHIEQSRTAPAIVATVPGLGHDAINTTLSSAGIDDRLDCTPSTCASPATHRSFLTSVASDYFNATFGGSTKLPLAANSAFPSQLGGLKAQWMAVTNSPKRITLFNADDVHASAKLSAGSTMKLCRFYDPQDPTPHNDSCPEASSGTVMMIGRASHVSLKPGGTMSVPAKVGGASFVNLQLTPDGDRLDHAKNSPLTVTVTTADGRSHQVPVPSSAMDATANRYTADTNGTYVLHTMRLPLPTYLASQVITGVQLHAPQGGNYVVRAIEIVGTKAAATPGIPKASSHKPPTVKPDSPTVLGPVVQTDHVTNPTSTTAPQLLADLFGGITAAYLAFSVKKAQKH